MILTKQVEITFNPKNITHFRNQGIEIKYRQKCFVPVESLPKYCGYKIDAQCENCGTVVYGLSMQKYSQNKDRGGIYTCKACNNIAVKRSMLEKYGVDNSSKCLASLEKRKKTCLERFGNEYAISSKHCIDKSKETSMERYGFEHPMKSDKIKFKGSEKSNITKIEHGFIIQEDKLSEWDKYRKEVRKLTERNRKELFDQWDGLDYYDGEPIKDNFRYKHTDQRFPTLDHKTSIIYGFKNEIAPIQMSSLDNLCVTKKINNSTKSFLTEEEYKAQKTQ